MQGIRPAGLILLVLSGCEGLLVTPDEADESQRSAASFAVGSKVKVCNCSALNFRASAKSSSKILDVLSPGTRGEVLAVSGSWHQLRLEDAAEGWSHGSYLCLDASGPGNSSDGGVEPPPAPAPAPAPAPNLPWSCTGSYGTKKASDGTYFTTSFGCWLDSNGVAHGDPGDNCIPACLAQARSSGLCQSGWSGKTCEQKTAWYVADSGRFGCLQRLRITNPVNGKAVVAVVLDAGPACWVEAKVKKEILDMSPPTAIHLFGTAAIGATEKKAVQVVEVPASTPLGPG